MNIRDLPLECTRGGIRLRERTAALVVATLFAAGATSAVWLIALKFL